MNWKLFFFYLLSYYVFELLRPFYVFLYLFIINFLYVADIVCFYFMTLFMCFFYFIVGLIKILSFFFLFFLRFLKFFEIIVVTVCFLNYSFTCLLNMCVFYLYSEWCQLEHYIYCKRVYFEYTYLLAYFDNDYIDIFYSFLHYFIFFDYWTIFYNVVCVLQIVDSISNYIYYFFLTFFDYSHNLFIIEQELIRHVYIYDHLWYEAVLYDILDEYEFMLMIFLYEFLFLLDFEKFLDFDDIFNAVFNMDDFYYFITLYFFLHPSSDFLLSFLFFLFEHESIHYIFIYSSLLIVLCFIIFTQCVYIVKKIIKFKQVYIIQSTSGVFDFIYIYIYSFFFKILNFFSNPNRLITRLNSSTYVFSYYTLFNYFNFSNFLKGIQSCWKFIRYLVLSLMCVVAVVLNLIYLYNLSVTKYVFIWFCVFMMFYWLISGFVFFIKKYQYGKYTSAIQRFWRRSFIIFWALETFLFCIFIYLLLNASQEPIFMYDFIQINKTHLFSWKYFFVKTILIGLLIFSTYLLLFFTKWEILNKYSYLFIFITVFLTYIVWLEFYQFFFTTSWYGELIWLFDLDNRTWNTDVVFKRTRIANHFVTICVIAKFWHLIFIYIFWIFFVCRVNELERSRYPLLSANLQNFIILYIMNFLLMYPWAKFFFRRFYNNFYFWFFLNPRKVCFRNFFYDFYIFVDSTLIRFIIFLADQNILFYLILKGITYPFYYWSESTFESNFQAYPRHFIRDYFLRTLYNNILNKCVVF